ncbi:MAG: hypothetical protein AT711_02000 [Thermoproteus sp. CIS_19]|nr:MAG: hypothetical protein AT711_02000 [Thermoproteus sp. CIS_19]
MRRDSNADLVRSAPVPISVVVPTYNEADNIKPLVEAIAKAFAGTPYELVIVDDGAPTARPRSPRSSPRNTP